MLFDANLHIQGIRDRLEHGHVYRRLAEYHANSWGIPPLTPNEPLPLPPRRGGPVEMPHLQENPHGKRCWKCNSSTHLSFCCLQKRKCYCFHCHSPQHWTSQCLFHHMNVTPDPTPNLWCGKCLHSNPRHSEIQCPFYEQCWQCGRRGPFMFLQTHSCALEEEPTTVNNDWADADLVQDDDPLIGGDPSFF